MSEPLYPKKEIDELRAKLKKTKNALAAATVDKEQQPQKVRHCPLHPGWKLVVVNADCDGDSAEIFKCPVCIWLELAQSEKVIAGMRENAAAIAARLGVDCEGMDDAATWHASAEAIEKSEKVAEKIVEALLERHNASCPDCLERPDLGIYPKSCKAKEALALYAAHKKDTQPGKSTHAYLSTACFHDKHTRCRQECKFCQTKCNCPCHDTQPGGGE